MQMFLEVLDVKIAAVNPLVACDRIRNWVKERKKIYVCAAPVSTLVQCQENEAYRQIINAAGMVTPDGMPLVWIGKWRKNKIIERTYGPDLMLALCDLGQSEGYRHYFYGGDSLTNVRLLEKLRSRFPGIRIAGSVSPPFKAVGEMEGDSVIAQINAANPDILWVGLGSPKQDYWMSIHRERLDVPVMVGVGAAFDFIAGTKLQAPPWVRRIGLEWLFRFCCEPQRMWKRYLIGNTKFIYYLIRDLVTKSGRL